MTTGFIRDKTSYWENELGSNARARQVAARKRRRRGQIAVGILAAGAVAAIFVAYIVIVNSGSAGDSATGTSSSRGSTGQVNSTESSIGKVFPTFNLAGLDGKPIGNATLAGKKSIIWFTDPYCVPVEQGSAKVKELAAELGGHPFNVIAVFVGPENRDSMTSWRDTFGRPDWNAVHDAEFDLARKVSLVAADTKFLLDQNGKILDVDTEPVDDGYLTMLRSAVAA